MISQIVAHSINHVIGNDNTLPWHYPEDLKHFKNKTKWKTILMWRKTYESIGRPLPHRTNIVLTRNIDRSAEWVEVVHSIDQIVDQYKTSDQELMVIWWQQIYELLLPYTDKLYITQVHREIEWDAFYPQYMDWFVETSRKVWDDYDFVEFERIQYDRPKVWLWVCIIKDNKVLFGKRKNSHWDWDRNRPWWHLEWWETREECAIRETMEEVWIEIKNISLMCTTNDIFRKDSKHYITLMMKAEYYSWVVELMEPDKHEDRQWFERDDLPEPLFLPIQNMIDNWMSPFSK